MSDYRKRTTEAPPAADSWADTIRAMEHVDGMREAARRLGFVAHCLSVEAIQFLEANKMAVVRQVREGEVEMADPKWVAALISSSLYMSLPSVLDRELPAEGTDPETIVEGAEEGGPNGEK